MNATPDHPAYRLLPTTARTLEVTTRTRQRDGRIPGLVASLARDGEVTWSVGVGRAHADEPTSTLDVDTPFLIASNTKTFVAAVVMALRDEGTLRLDAGLGDYLPGTPHGDTTIRSLLSHVTGLQREPVGDVWDVLDFPDRDRLLAELGEAERIGDPHLHWHYSNLGYALLGEVVARLDGGDWFESVRRRILEPLEMRSTTLAPRLPTQGAGRLAGTYFVPPWTDVPLAEPVLDLGAVASAGALASTARDMSRWGGFLASPVDEILSAATVEEMCAPVAVADVRGWTQTWGLGFMLVRRDNRTWVGHTGGMPGAITGIFTHRESATTACLLMNASNATDPAGGAVELGSRWLEDEPPMPEEFVPGESVPEELAGLVGPWFSEGHAFTFVVCRGVLQARADRAPADEPPSVFEPVGRDVYRTVSGGERGELLRVDRDASGAVVSLHWATYLFTREPRAFGPR